jgi:hypothetical protein
MFVIRGPRLHQDKLAAGHKTIDRYVPYSVLAEVLFEVNEYSHPAADVKTPSHILLEAKTVC